MRKAPFGITSLSVVLAAAACADSEAQRIEQPLEDAGLNSSLDGATPDAAPDVAPPDVEVGPAKCSDAGWCVTDFPEPDITLTDIWPLEGHAFATSAGSILEWDDVRASWIYIDYNPQRGPILDNVWAPNKDEVYVAAHGNVSAGWQAYLYYGKRPAAPASPAQAWSWTRIDFGCDANRSYPQVWGTSADNIYFWACETVFHSKDGAADAGAAAWTPEFVDADPDPKSPLRTLGVTGRGPDDIWFLGVRGESWSFGGGCSVVIHKSAAGYAPVVDGTVGVVNTDCHEKAGLPLLKGALSDGNLATAHASAPDRLVATVLTRSGLNSLVRIDASGGGAASITVAIPAEVTLRSVWGASEDDLWLVAARTPSVGNILRGTRVWNEEGTYEISTLARNGLPNLTAIRRLRGTSSTLWALGVGNAYRKTIL